MLFEERLCSPIEKKLPKQFMDNVDLVLITYIRVRLGVLMTHPLCIT